MKKLKMMIAAMLVLCSAAMLYGCSDGNLGDYIDDMELGDYVSSADDGDISQYVMPGSDIIPESLIGTWEPTELYQYAIASDISDEEAMRCERECCLSMGYSTFQRYDDEINDAVFKVNTEATLDDIRRQGIQIDPLVEHYGDTAKVTAIDVYNGNGAFCTTIYYIEEDVIISYGAGMNVFKYERMEAIG